MLAAREQIEFASPFATAVRAAMSHVFSSYVNDDFEKVELSRDDRLGDVDFRTVSRDLLGPRRRRAVASEQFQQAVDDLFAGGWCGFQLFAPDLEQFFRVFRRHRSRDICAVVGGVVLSLLERDSGKARVSGTPTTQKIDEILA